MKKLKSKLLALVLGATMVVGSAVGMAGCDNGSSSNETDKPDVDAQIYAVYTAYQENGGTLSYDEWYAALLASAKGEKGDKGDKGDPGEDGKDGVDGKDGADGAQGPQGEKGEKGDPGTDGKDGADGVDGVDGVDGEDGAQGAQGPQGPQGPQGLQGEKGEKGDKGDTGAAGEQGPQGLQGEQGEKGDKGNGWLVGTADPTAEDGTDGDLWLNSTTWDVWYKTEGVWSQLGNISGSSAASNKITLKATEKKDVAIEVDAGYYELHITVESGEPAAGALIARVDSMTDVDGSGANYDIFYDLYDSVANGYWGVLNITDSDKVLHFQASSKYNEVGADVSFTYELVPYQKITLKADGQQYRIPTTPRKFGIPLGVDPSLAQSCTITFAELPSIYNGPMLVLQNMSDEDAGFLGTFSSKKQYTATVDLSNVVEAGNDVGIAGAIAALNFNTYVTITPVQA